MESTIQPQEIESVTPNIVESPKFKSTKFPSKQFLLFLILILFGSTLYFLSQTSSLKKQMARINSLPSPSPTYIYTAAPSPTSTPTSYVISVSRQTTNLLIPKYLDTPLEKETYKISFNKVGANPKYYFTTDLFPKLVIEGDKYQFTLQIPKEGQVGDFTKIPPTSEVLTNQFNSITRITNPFNYTQTGVSEYEKDKLYYVYTSYYSTNCNQFTPVPPACSSFQISYGGQPDSSKEISFYASCTSSDQSSSNCDEIISTLGIELTNK